MPDITLLPYPHTCYEAELRYDPDMNWWECSVCGRRYHAPQIKIPVIPVWMPWKIPVEKLCVPAGRYWIPWRDYRLWKVRSEFRVWA